MPQESSAVREANLVTQMCACGSVPHLMHGCGTDTPAHVWVSLWTDGVSRLSTGMGAVGLHRCKVLPELIISDEMALMLQGVVH